MKELETLPLDHVAVRCAYIIWSLSNIHVGHYSSICLLISRQETRNEKITFVFSEGQLK